MRRLLGWFICLFILLLANGSNAAEQQPQGENRPSRAVNRKGITAELGGVGWLYSLNFDYYITPNINFEFGGSFLTRFPVEEANLFFSHVGGKYALTGHRPGQRWSPYIGAMFTVVVVNTDVTFLTSGTLYSQTLVKERVAVPFFGAYFPLGIELVAFNGFTFAFEFGFVYVPSQKKNLQSSTSPGANAPIELLGISGPWLGIRLGFHF